MLKEEVRKIVPFFVDERGIITDIVEEAVKHVGIITSKKGSVRGKHYHKKSTQFIYVISGKLELVTKDLRIKNSKTKSIALEPGYFAVTPPMVVHKLIFLEDTVFLDISTESRGMEGYEKDTVRVDI